MNIKQEKMKTQLTVAEAIAEGYEYAGIKDIGWQNYSEIADLHPEDIGSGVFYLASKEKQHPYISADMLKELIVEDIDSRFGDETGCDDSTVSDALHDIDLSEIEVKINEALSVIWSSKITDIQLIN